MHIYIDIIRSLLSIWSHLQRDSNLVVNLFVERASQFQAVLFLTVSPFMGTVNRIINRVYIYIK